MQINSSKGGVPKMPVESAEIDGLGIRGDEHRYCYHGGPRKALLLIASEVIGQLCTEGWPLFHGALGENLTTVGLDHRCWRPGMRYQIGEVVIELVEARQPCATLNRYGRGIQRRIYDAQVKAGDWRSIHWGESGFYAAVVRGGLIKRGMEIVLTG